MFGNALDLIHVGFSKSYPNLVNHKLLNSKLCLVVIQYILLNPEVFDKLFENLNLLTHKII